MYQHTLTKAVEFSGKGLHGGKNAHMILRPAPAGSGIVFRHIDSNGQTTEIPALWTQVKSMPECNCIASNTVQVRTIEHLMAAFYACNITNVIVDIRGNEVPIMDGSARPFIESFQAAGIQQQESSRKVIRILKSVTFREGNRYVSISPCDDFYLDLTISLAKIGQLNWKGIVTPEVFLQEIAMARTFGRLKNAIVAKLVTRFWKDPIALGATTGNSLSIVGNSVINKGGLRVPDEYIRHRILDMVGDMMLAGAEIKGCITGNSTAHRLNNELLKNVFSDNSTWCWDN